MKIIKKFLSCSLFMQLLVIFLITGLMIFFVLAGSFKYVVSQNLKESFQPHVEYYVKSLISDIGTPPNIERAKEIVDSTPVGIKIHGPDLQWSSFKPIQRKHNLEYISAGQPGVSYAKSDHDFYINVEKEDYRYTFKYSLFDKHSGHNPAGIAVLLVIILLIFFCYLLIKRLFKPIKWIEEGTIQFSQGNFDHLIKVKNCDELGRLTNEINHMAQEIKKMLESKQQLLLAISHELRTPLTRTKLSLEFIEDSQIKSKISEDIYEIENLINDLLESERLSSDYCSLNLTNESIGSAINQTIDKYFQTQKNRISFASTPELISAPIDKLRVQLLLKNLITNALNYSEDKVEIKISTEIYSNKPECIITISDSGIGIPQDAIEHITEPFYRVDPSRHKDTGGHGLGLFLCQLIVKAHKGRIVFESVEGKGTNVRICLPISL